MVDVYPVKVTDAPEENDKDNLVDENKLTLTEVKPTTEKQPKPFHILIILSMNNRLSITQGNLIYRKLQASSGDLVSILQNSIAL